MTAETIESTESLSLDAGDDLQVLVEELTAFLDRAEARLGPEPPSLTGAAKRRLPKPRRGAEKLIGAITTTVEQYQLQCGLLNTNTIRARLAVAEVLKPLDTRLEKIKKRVSDELFSARGDAWRMSLQYYALLRHRSRGDGELRANIEPLLKAFAFRHPRVKEATPTKVQTRAKRKLQAAVAFAERHGVPVPPEVNGVDVEPPADAATAAPVR